MYVGRQNWEGKTVRYTAKKSFIFSMLVFLVIVFAIRQVSAQHYSSAYHQSGWQSANTPSSRVSTLPTYGKRVAKRRAKQAEYNRKQQREKTAFDTLSETGLYFGLSLGKGKVTGKMTSTYCDPEVPGNCSDGNAEAGDSTSIGLAFGVAVTSTTRLELTYTKYADMKYGDTASHNDGFGTRDLQVSGGDIESNLLMANFFYSLEDMFGNFSGGKLIPYFGFGLGLAFNSVSEYTISDPDGYVDTNACIPGNAFEHDGGWVAVDPFCDTYYNGETTYAGASTQNIAWGFELGITYKMQNRMFLDFFFKHTNLGEVKTSGMVVNDYFLDSFYTDGTLLNASSSTLGVSTDDDAIDEDVDLAVFMDEGDQIINAFYDGTEKDDYSITELGVKIRIMF